MLFNVLFITHVEPCQTESMIFWSRPNQKQFERKTSVYQIKGEKEIQWLDGLDKPLLH